MTEHPDPGGEAAARAAQLAAMTLSVAEAIARLRAQRANERAEQDRRFEAALRATERSQSARDALQYRAAMSPTWMREQDTRVLLNTWHAAVPHVGEDPVAHQAVLRIEERLRQLHPEAMHAFDVGSDLTPQQRMEQASSLFRGPYGLDPVGTPPDVPHPGLPPDERASEAIKRAFPVSTQDAMRTAPGAGRRAVLAITAGPIRKQITATPHVERSTR